MRKTSSRKNFDYIIIRIKIWCFVVLVLLMLIGVLLGILSVIEMNMTMVLLVFGIAVALLCYGGYWFIYKPYQEICQVFQLFMDGYVFQDIFALKHPISAEMVQLLEKFRKMLESQDLINMAKKQAEYLALQNQINPHFLYNTLEGIRSEALLAGMDDIARMTEALSTFFRYTISNVEKLVTLEDELANIESYYIIQQYRFGDRLNYSVEIDSASEKEILGYQLPKLILQPIVENSIYHGIERKIGKGKLKIKIEATAKRLLITISDDGLGMSQEKLTELRERLRSVTYQTYHNQDKKRGGIAILNVSNRIKLLFGEDYGITIYSRLNAGTDVDISLPLIKNGEKWEGQVDL